MPKLAILHYLPLEYYPPVTNLMDYITNGRSTDFKMVKAYSCHNVKGRNAYQAAGSEEHGARGRELGAVSVKRKAESVERRARSKGQDKGRKSKRKLDSKRIANSPSLFIKRSPFPKEGDNSLVRLFKYLHYNLFTLVRLIAYRPTALLYYESYSAWPAYIYTKYLNRKCRIYIHNHEYAPKEWYAGTMKQVRYFHLLEKKWLYPKAQWISQTNADRLQFFHQDHPTLKPEQLKIMPNYPPRSWKANFKNPTLGAGGKNVTQQPIKLVYVGSLSLSNTYVQEFCKWVILQNGEVLFDIYAYNLHQDTTDYLESLHTPFINFFDKGIEYNEIPKVLSQYHVGIIFYKAYSENVINCVSNKFYEYLACNLDVWFSDIMNSTHVHVTSNTYPKVVPVNFENLDTFNWPQAMDKINCQYKPSTYFCEEVYKELADEIVRL